MRRGFTIVEMLVASVLMGMLMVILTMIFSQSSIAWRTGTAGVVDTDNVRRDLSRVRMEADNAYLWNSQLRSVLSIWKPGKNELRKRAVDTTGSDSVSAEQVQLLNGYVSATSADIYDAARSQNIGVGSASADSGDNYLINVMSAGPDREFDTYDDIWSFPDDFE